MFDLGASADGISTATMSGNTHVHFRELNNAVDSTVNAHRVLYNQLGVSELQGAVQRAVRIARSTPGGVNDQAIVDFLLAVSRLMCYESCCDI